MARGADPRTISRAARSRNRTPVDRRTPRGGSCRLLHVRRVWRRAIRRRHQVRQPLWLAVVLRDHQPRCRGLTRGQYLGANPNRSSVCVLQGPPRPRLPRRVRNAHRASLLHEFHCAEVHAGRLTLRERRLNGESRDVREIARHTVASLLFCPPQHRRHLARHEFSARNTQIGV